MPRLTRTESRSVTRQKLVDAAADVFADKGFAGSALEEIADAAGFSRGAVYSNFSGKDELFMEVMAQRREARYREIARLLRHNPAPDAFVRALETETRDPVEVRRWFLLRMEFFLYAMRQPDALAALAEHERVIRREVGEATAVLFKTLGANTPLPIDEIAAVNQALDDGLLLQHYVDPEAVPRRLYYDSLRYLLETATRQE